MSILRFRYNNTEVHSILFMYDFKLPEGFNSFPNSLPSELLNEISKLIKFSFAFASQIEWENLVVAGVERTGTHCLAVQLRTLIQTYISTRKLFRL